MSKKDLEEVRGMDNKETVLGLYDEQKIIILKDNI
jgi:hypothetical protein